MTSLPLTALAPLVLLAAMLPFLARPGRRPGRLLLLAEAATLASLSLALAGLAQLWASGAQVLALGETALLRLDPISSTMALLVTFVGWVVVRYSRRYLDGEAREGRFHGLTLTAIAAVLVLVTAASLPVLVASFAATGLILRQLLLFYPERAEAQRAAAKFLWVWGAGDLALILASILLWHSLATVNIAALTQMGSLSPSCNPLSPV